MKRSTLIMAFKVAKQMRYNLNDYAEVAIDAAEKAEYLAASRMGTSGQPDWLAPWHVTDSDMITTLKVAINNSSYDIPRLKKK